MIERIEELLRNNEAFVAEHLRLDPDYFAQLSQGQHPSFLWIGCSDSRVSPDSITGTQPGDMFVHRNIANLVVQTDMNLLSVLQYAVDVLKVKHVIVCGHYGCGGVRAALNRDRLGLIDNWLRHVQDVVEQHQQLLAPITDVPGKTNRLCELNVIEQVRHVCQTTIVQEAWARGQAIAIHGWIYGLHDGRLRDLGVSTSDVNGIDATYQAALGALGSGQVIEP
jgi:carbonic anhydrase